MEAKLWKKKKKLLSKKSSNQDLKKHSDAITWVEKVERRVELMEAGALKAIDNYNKSAALYQEVIKASSFSYNKALMTAKQKLSSFSRN